MTESDDLWSVDELLEQMEQQQDQIENLIRENKLLKEQMESVIQETNNHLSTYANEVSDIKDAYYKRLGNTQVVYKKKLNRIENDYKDKLKKANRQILFFKILAIVLPLMIICIYFFFHFRGWKLFM